MNEPLYTYGLNISKIENIIIHITDIDDEAPIIEANQIFHITENSKKDHDNW